MDESFTALLARLPWGELSAFVAKNDVHPPLYFAYSRLFNGLGSDGFVLRLPAAIAGAAALPLIYLAGTFFGRAGEAQSDRLVGLIALVLAGLATTLIAQSQNARAYSLMFLGFASVTAGAAFLLRHEKAASRPFWARDGLATVPALSALAAGLLLLLWSHNIGVLFAVCTGLVLLVFWATALGAARGAFANLFTVAIVVTLGWWPQFQTLVVQWAAVSSDYWIRPPTPTSIAMFAFQVMGDADDVRALHPDEICLALILFASGGWALTRMLAARQFGQFILAGGFVFGTFIALIAVSYLARPVLLDRTLAPIAAPWFVIVASGLAAIRRPALQAATIGVTMLLAAYSVAIYHFVRLPKGAERWNDIPAAILHNSAGRPLVITLPNSAAVALSYHAAQTAADIDVLALPGRFPTHSADGRYPTGWPGVPALTADSLTEADKRIATADGDVWLLLRGYWTYDPQALLRRHFDADYCYRALYLPKVDYLFLLKLVPKDQAADAACISFAADEYYPYTKPDAGQIFLPDDD